MNDWETRREAERAAARERVAAFGVFAKLIAEQLGVIEEKTWKYAPGNNDNDSFEVRAYGELVGDGLNLHLSLYREGSKDRIRVSGSWPREKNGSHLSLREAGVVPYGGSEPVITVGLPADAVRIAKDIKRRLIEGEGLRAKYAKVLEVIAQREAYANRKDTLIASLFDTAGLPQPKVEPYERDRRASLRLYDFAPGVSYGDLEVRGDDSVQINVNVNGEVARAFLELLKARKAAHSE